MPEKTYTYYGPLSAVSLPADEAHPGGRDVQLSQGEQVTLPDDNAYVQSLAARKHLVPVVESEAETTASPAAAIRTVATTAATGATPASGVSAAETAKPAASNGSSSTVETVPHAVTAKGA